MKVAVKRLWSEQDGAIVSAEIVLVASICVIGLIAGLTSLRDGVVTELADLGAAIGGISQSFSYGGVVGHCGSSAGGTFTDFLDFCDGTGGQVEQNSKCIAICFGVGSANEVSGT